MDKRGQYIQKLYTIERDVRELDLSDDEFVDTRRDRAGPVLKEFKQWLEKKIDQVPPKTKLGEGVNYCLNQWPKMIRYLEQAFLTPDTNTVENAIRPFTVGRRNWLFSNTPRGAHASAALFSLVETAKANALQPYLYLKYLFEKFPYAETKEDREKLLPTSLALEDLTRV